MCKVATRRDEKKSNVTSIKWRRVVENCFSCFAGSRTSAKCGTIQSEKNSHEKKFNSSRTPLTKENSVYNKYVYVQVVDWVVEKMHNASAAIKNNDDSKNDGALYKHTADVFIYIGPGDSWSQCRRCDLYNNEECTGMRCWHCRCLYIRSRSISYLAFPIISLDWSIYILYVYTNWTIKEKN